MTGTASRTPLVRKRWSGTVPAVAPARRQHRRYPNLYRVHVVDLKSLESSYGQELIYGTPAAEYARDAPTAAVFTDATVPSAVLPPSGYSLSGASSLHNLGDVLGSPVSYTTTQLGRSPSISPPTIYAPVARKPVDTFLSDFRLTLPKNARKNTFPNSTPSCPSQPSSAPAAPPAHNFDHEMSSLAAISSIQQQCIRAWSQSEFTYEGGIG